MAGADEGSRIRDVVRDSKIRLDIQLKPYQKFDSFTSETNRDLGGLRHHLKHDYYYQIGRDFPRTIAGGVGEGSLQCCNSLNEYNYRWVRRELPLFHCTSHIEDFYDWVDAIEVYFDKNNLPENLKCVLVSYTLEGEDEIWWQQLQLNRIKKCKAKISSWSRMKALLFKNFMHITCSIKGSPEVENNSKVVNYVNYGRNIPVGRLLQTDEEERKTGCEYDAEAHNNDEIAMEKIDKFTPTKCLSKIPNQRKEQEILEECENVSLSAFNYDTTIDDKESVAKNDASELHIEKAKYELDASLTEESLIQEGENPRNEAEEMKGIAGDEFDTTNLHMNKTECEFEAYTTNQLVASAGSVVENTLSVAERRMTPVNMMFGSTSRLEDIGERDILTIQQPKAEELLVNEVLEAAGGIYNAHIGELQIGLYQQIPEPWVIVVDDRGQLIGTTVILYLFQVLILNLLVRYRIIIAGMLSFMFDPGGVTSQHELVNGEALSTINCPGDMWQTKPNTSDGHEQSNVMSREKMTWLTLGEGLVSKHSGIGDTLFLFDPGGILYPIRSWSISLMSEISIDFETDHAMPRLCDWSFDMVNENIAGNRDILGLCGSFYKLVYLMRMNSKFCASVLINIGDVTIENSLNDTTQQYSPDAVQAMNSVVTLVTTILTNRETRDLLKTNFIGLALVRLSYDDKWSDQAAIWLLALLIILLNFCEYALPQLSQNRWGTDLPLGQPIQCLRFSGHPGIIILRVEETVKLLSFTSSGASCFGQLLEDVFPGVCAVGLSSGMRLSWCSLMHYTSLSGVIHMDNLNRYFRWNHAMSWEISYAQMSFCFCLFGLILLKLVSDGIKLGFLQHQTRGRFTPLEGWDDDKNANIEMKQIVVEICAVIIGSSITTLFKNGRHLREFLKLSYNVVNGLDPPTNPFDDASEANEIDLPTTYPTSHTYHERTLYQALFQLQLKVADAYFSLGSANHCVPEPVATIYDTTHVVHHLDILLEIIVGVFGFGVVFFLSEIIVGGFMVGSDIAFSLWLLKESNIGCKFANGEMRAVFNVLKDGEIIKDELVSVVEGCDGDDGDDGLVQVLKCMNYILKTQLFPSLSFLLVDEFVILGQMEMMQ